MRRRQRRHLDEALAPAGREELGEERSGVGDLGDEPPVQRHNHSVQAGQRAAAATAAAIYPAAAATAAAAAALGAGREHGEHALPQALVHCPQLCSEQDTSKRAGERTGRASQQMLCRQQTD